jgi:hypothetical protein
LKSSFVPLVASGHQCFFSPPALAPGASEHPRPLAASPASGTRLIRLFVSSNPPPAQRQRPLRTFYPFHRDLLRATGGLRPPVLFPPQALGACARGLSWQRELQARRNVHGHWWLRSPVAHAQPTVLPGRLRLSSPAGPVVTSSSTIGYGYSRRRRRGLSPEPGHGDGRGPQGLK